MQIGIVDEVRAINVAAVVDSRTQAEIPAECDPNDGEGACCEVQAGEEAKDSPSSPPNIVRIVLKEKTPNSPYFNPVVVAPSIVALSTDDVPSNATETLSPKENFLAPSVSSSAATAWIHNRSINSNPRHSMPPDNEVCNNGVSINCSKRQRQQSSMDASSASGLTTPLCSSNCSQCAPEVILPHLSREAENENHTTCPVSSVGQHDDASIASFGQDNDALLSPRSSELSNGQQQHMQCMQYVHLNNSLSPTSTVAATVHERTVTRKKMQACNGVGEDRPLPVPSGEAGQRKRFGLLTTHSLDFPDLAEQIEDSPSKEIDNKPMIHPRSKRKVRKIEKRLLATTRKPVVHIPSSTLISLSQRMEEPPSWQFSLK